MNSFARTEVEDLVLYLAREYHGSSLHNMGQDRDEPVRAPGQASVYKFTQKFEANVDYTEAMILALKTARFKWTC